MNGNGTSERSFSREAAYNENLPTQIEAELEKLLHRPIRLYVVATGAGAGIQQMIWSVPGCSSFLMGASFPYSPEESTDFAFGLTPKSFASEEFSLDLAMAAYQRAIDLDDPSKEPVGLAISASVAGIRKHRGEHRVHIVCMTKDRVIGQTLVLSKDNFGGEGKDARAADGMISDWEAVMTLIAAVNPGHEWEARTEDLTLQASNRFFENPVFRRGKRYPWVDPGAPLFAGAFNPPHLGHHNIAKAVGKHYERETTYAICSTPVHKPALSVQDMLYRAKTLRDHSVFFGADDALFINKARQHPGTPLVIGADALIRMLDPKWGPDPIEMLGEFSRLGTQFAVFGRVDGENFVSASDAMAKVPADFIQLFMGFPGRWDVSSTEIRRRLSESRTKSDGAAPTH